MHKSVLLNEAIEGLNLKEGSVFVDCTLGAGGHSEAVCKRFGKKVKIFAIDADVKAIERSKARLGESECDIKFAAGNFRNLDRYMQDAGISKADALLFDLGFSSDQLETSLRGFSFRNDEPLYMTYEENPGDDVLTAAKIINGEPEEEIARILYEYGEEWRSRKIAKAIVTARSSMPIETSGELAMIVSQCLGRRGKLHPATKTFQALRIATNDELGALTEALPKAWNLLNIGGRLAVISFHSLEDRIVKYFMKGKASEGRGTLITKKPIRPTREENLDNPRARSSKLRIIEKLN